MITIESGSTNTYILKQVFTQPSVYLDLWAIREVASDATLTSRFTNALHRRGGTLALSWVLLLEISKIAPGQSRDQIMAWLESLGANVAFLQPLADRVIGEENRLMAIPPHRWDQGPHHDRHFLRLASTCAKPPRLLDVAGLFRLTEAPGFAEQRAQMERAAISVNESLARQRKKRTDDPSLARLLNEPLKTTDPVFPHPTRYVVSELFRSLVRGDKNMSTNDWLDLFHMEVPVSYLDLVLLDRSWCALAKDIGARLAQAGLLTHYARLFSKSSLQEFWEAFDV